MNEEFIVRLDGAFRNAAGHRDWREAWKKQAQADPTGAAARVRAAVAEGLARERAESAELYGIDISNPASGEDYDVTLAEAADILQRVNHYQMLLWAQQRLDSYAADSSLPEQEYATKVCETGLELWRALDSLLLHTLRWIRLHAAPGEEARLAADAEATHLAGHLATRTSVAINRPLAKALDDIREHNKPTSRARFEALLSELYANAPQEWDKHHALDWRLDATRNAVVKGITGRSREESPTEAELATFAEREALLKRAREAGLTPREHELFALVVGDPKRFLRNNRLNHKEAAAEMGVAVGTTKSLWSRIRKALAA